AVDAQRNQFLRASIGGHVAGDQLHVRQAMLIDLIASITREEWPCAVSTASTSALVLAISTARSIKSPVAPTAAPTRNRPWSSFAARGYSSFFWMSFTVIRPFRLKS